VLTVQPTPAPAGKHRRTAPNAPQDLPFIGRRPLPAHRISHRLTACWPAIPYRPRPNPGWRPSVRPQQLRASSPAAFHRLCRRRTHLWRDCDAPSSKSVGVHTTQIIHEQTPPPSPRARPAPVPAIGADREQSIRRTQRNPWHYPNPALAVRAAGHPRPTSNSGAGSAGHGSIPRSPRPKDRSRPRTGHGPLQRIEARDSNPTGDSGYAPTSITMRQLPMAFFSRLLFALLHHEPNDAHANCSTYGRDR
jgi:hypothetical protein